MKCQNIFNFGLFVNVLRRLYFHDCDEYLRDRIWGHALAQWYFKIHDDIDIEIFVVQVDLDVIGRHPEDVHESVYVVRLQLRQPRIVRSNNGRPIKHTVDRNVEKKLSKPFFFLRNVKGDIREVFYPREDQPDVVGLKKGKRKYFHCFGHV